MAHDHVPINVFHGEMSQLDMPSVHVLFHVWNTMYHVPKYALHGI